MEKGQIENIIAKLDEKFVKSRERYGWQSRRIHCDAFLMEQFLREELGSIKGEEEDDSFAAYANIKHYSRKEGVMVMLMGFLVGFMAPTWWVCLGFIVSLPLSYAVDVAATRFFKRNDPLN